MTVNIQYNLKNNPNYLKYIREHSIWYKTLSRNPNLFKEFEKEVKAFYKQRATDKIEKTLSTIELVQNILTTIK